MYMLVKEMSFAVIMGWIAAAFVLPPRHPTLRFDTELHDFGRIPQGRPVMARFRFVNNGTAPLIVLSVEPACGCTTVFYTQAAVLPGHSGIIEVRFDAAKPHAFEKQVVVRSNSVMPIKVLFIRGVVVEPIGSPGSPPRSS